ncbi:hypothetical protein PsorP6_015496 [Peronosclerospora sorghi]|uniref:Uncharacterized protein n=1 Tax=Peronosclerospora sorghi TaxID=230839 RepID=A0ACC0WQ61_9STRA|nr:hypothetical protein PsorP6_015496 [Peronosclerospora sorghi]
MVRTGRGRRGGTGNDGATRPAPYEGARGSGSRRRGGSAKGRGGRGGRGGRRHKPPSKTAEELDADMDRYWIKSAEHASKKLDGDMDEYWKNKKDQCTACDSICEQRDAWN